MQIYRCAVPKKKLAALPDVERRFFLMIGHLANELTILNKLFFWACKYDEDKGPREQAGITQPMLIGKIFVGKLYEGWNVLQKAYHGSKLSKEYDSLLTSEAKDALDSLKRYFSTNENLIDKVRNSFAFHYPTKPEKQQLIEKVFDETPETEQWEVLLGEKYANTLYYTSEMVLGRTMLQDIDSDPNKAMKRLMEETIKVFRLFRDFIDGCMQVIFEKRLGFKIQDCNPIEINEELRFDEVRLPFFVETDGLPDK
jgi:hypothetical protein